jgi:hypothetical protein
VKARIVRDLPLAAYLAIPSVHFSTLKAADTSALHYRHAVDHARADTAALTLGRILHAAILTPDAPIGVAVWDGTRRGKAWEAFEAANGHMTIVTRTQLDTSRAMRAAVLAHPIARALLSEGEGEVTIEWDAGALPSRARLDWLRPNGSIVEVKTTRSIHPRAFAADFARRMYHAQLAFYSRGLTEAQGHGPPELPAMIVVESQPPFDVCVYRIGYDSLEAGERKVSEWLRTVEACTTSGRWPGVGADVMDMRLPDWALGDGLPDVDMGTIGGDE